MVGASKILTVSYGTFSCTLEGFDEPFKTMKAIAEYFRDLAAEDRFFGAEPPQPDTEMLHRIAEREIQRRVEAKVSENGIVLRQPESVEDEEAAEAEAPAAPQGEALPSAPVAETAVAEPEVAVEPEVTVDTVTVTARSEAPATAPEAEAVPESVAAKLQRIREAVARARAAQSETVVEEDEPSSVAEGMAARFAPEPSAESEDFGYELDISGPLSSDEIIEELAEEVEETEVAEEAETVEATVDVTATEDATEAQDKAAEAEERLQEVVAEAEEAPEERTAEEAVSEEPVEEIEEIEEISLEIELAEDASAEEAAEETDEAVAEETAEAEEEPVTPIRARVIKVRRPEQKMAQAPAETPVEPAEEDDLAARLASELAAETAAEEAEEQEPVTGSLSAEAEAELMRELAALEMEEPASAAIAEEPEEAAEEFEAPVARQADEDERAEEALGEEHPKADVLILGETAKADEEEAGGSVVEEQELDREAEMSRLLEEADKQAKGEDTRRRFSAIAHLKAAVAATVADRIAKGQDTAKGGAPESDASEPYREDLTQAVRPRRPVSAGEPSARRPEPMRPSPLVLVSEQRIHSAPDEDEPETEAAETQMVRPRRISTAQFATSVGGDDGLSPLDPQQAKSFAEFAESLGPQGLSDILEAAAAYTSVIEGRPHFSPPQIMRKLSSFEETAEVPREERMRVFGRLLRQGKITKVKRGQYAITEASRYWDEAKMASGQ
ncbi:hypothetical protein [Thioclava atlantica]|uniref:Lipoprotein n=1 Tax=Thioclava atlantica TaxID=1317124 RepID=A0A085U1T6_9RHOB|nr:hypothetical protein [Thioclava atlantica]KFE36933.1 lipoprotein [Thioclava atlantica]